MKQNNEYSINVDLWPAGKWDKEELKKLKNIFNELGETSGQISNEPRGLSSQIGIEFFAYAVAVLFFRKLIQNLADDSYNYIKNKIKDIALKKESKLNFSELEDYGYLYIKYKDIDNNMKFYYANAYTNEEQLDIFLNSLHKLDSLIHSAYKLQIFPFDEFEQFSIHIELNFLLTPKFKIRVTRSTEDNGVLLTNQNLDSEFHFENIDKLNFSELLWEDIDLKILEFMEKKDIEGVIKYLKYRS
jgi:hypothetical protein